MVFKSELVECGDLLLERITFPLNVFSQVSQTGVCELAWFHWLPFATAGLVEWNQKAHRHDEDVLDVDPGGPGLGHGAAVSEVQELAGLVSATV